MAGFVSTKQLLSVYDINAPKDDKGNPSRGTAHEFQDYAYRLAANLNDLENLKIYMRLTKSYPRFLLDRTYESIAESNEDNKGRLFMWKFKKIRTDIQLKRDLNNFEYEHVIKKMKKLRDTHAKSIIKKNDNIETNFLTQFLTECPNIFGKDNKKILIIGSVSTLLPSMFDENVHRITGIDISIELTRNLKSIFNKNNKKRFITKDFISNSFKLHEYNTVILQNYWDIIPLEAEEQFIKEIQRVLAPEGFFLLNYKTAENSSQFWKERRTQESIFHYFQKLNNPNELLSRFSSFDFCETNNKAYNSEQVICFKHIL